MLLSAQMAGDAESVRSAPAFLTGGGEAGALVRAIDWAQHAARPDRPAGRTACKTIVGTLLHSRHPMFLWWGPELIQFYNDAYLPELRPGQAPGGDGTARRRLLAGDLADHLAADRRRHAARATASWNEDQLVPIFRNGRIEEVYWTYGYSPVFDETGGVGGTLVVCTETTGARASASGGCARCARSSSDTALATSPTAVLERAAERVRAGEPPTSPSRCSTPSTPPCAAARSRAAIGVDGRALEALDAQSPRCGGRARRAAESPTPLPLPPRDRAAAGDPWPEPVAGVFVAPDRGRRRQATARLRRLRPQPAPAVRRRAIATIFVQLAEQRRPAQSRASRRSASRAVIERRAQQPARAGAGGDRADDRAGRTSSSSPTRSTSRWSAARPRRQDATSRRSPSCATRRSPASSIASTRPASRSSTNEMLVPLDRSGDGTRRGLLLQLQPRAAARRRPATSTA